MPLQTEEVSQMTSFVTSDGIYVGKKRKAHVMELKKEGQQEIRIAGNKASRNNPVEIPAKRPRIPVEFGSKVPQVIRQRYLDKIIDEYTAKFPSLQEVYDKVIFSYFLNIAMSIHVSVTATVLHHLAKANDVNLSLNFIPNAYVDGYCFVDFSKNSLYSLESALRVW